MNRFPGNVFALPAIAAVACCLLAAAPAAMAQSTADNQSTLDVRIAPDNRSVANQAAVDIRSVVEAQLRDNVLARERRDYDPIGIPVGGFRLFPSIAGGYTYDDNVYLTETGHQGDSILTAIPKLAVLSDWNRHSLDLVAGLTQYEYLSEYSNNRKDWFLGGLGRLDILRGVTLSSDVHATQLHEARNSPNSPGLIASPVQYIQDHADARLTYRPYRVGFDLGGSFDHYNYFATSLIGGGVLDNRDRDEDTYTAFATGYYEFYPGYAAFLRATRSHTSYTLDIDRTGVNRNSVGNQFDSGIRLQLANLVSGEAFLGYLSHNYHNPLPGVSGLDFGAKILWNFTPLMTLRFTAARVVIDTTVIGTSAENDKQFALALDYELLRNLIILVEGDYTLASFPGSSRHDQLQQANIGARFLFNRYLSVTARYTPSWRESNVAGQSYNDSMIGLSVKAQL